MLSQSTVKSFETASCYRRWQAERTGELSRFVSDPMKKGSYFEFLALGSGSGKSDEVVDLERLKNGNKSAEQIRIEKQADKFKLMFNPDSDIWTGWYIQDKQIHLQHNNMDGTIDFTAQREEFRIADLKLTADLEADYGYWSNPNELDFLQATTYTYLWSQKFEFINKFDYWIYDYSTKMNVLNVEVTVSDEATRAMERRFVSTETSILEFDLLDEYPRIPSIAACRYCKLTCDKRLNKANYNQIQIVI